MFVGLLMAAAAQGIVPAPVAAQPPILAQAPQVNQATLPANTEILLRMNDALTSKSVNEGDSFSLSVANDVLLAGYVVIPRGTRAVGEVTWKTGKGMFGKSGKMEIELRYIDLNGRRIPVEGKFRQEGSGNTVATVTSVALLWPVAPVVTGKSATIPRGRELMAHTTEALAVALPGPPMAAPIRATGPAPVIAAAPPAPTSLPPVD